MHEILTNPLWWHWMALGFILIAAEIIVPSFVIIWFGAAAVFVSIVDFIFNTDFSTEIFWWIVFTIFFEYMWFKKFKPKTLTKSGQADESIGTKGVAIEKIEPFGRGKARFETPVLGSSEWIVTSDESIKNGEEVVSVKALGNMIKVKKAN